MHDVLIAGAGPAGLATAIACRHAGLSVLVVDALEPPIDKACGEGLMPDSLAAFQRLGIDLSAVPSGRFEGIRFLSGETAVQAPFPAGQGIGVRRRDLSAALLERAAEAGADFRWRTTLRNVCGTDVQCDSGTLQARWIVGADGHNSRVRSLAGLGKQRQHSSRIGLRQHYRIAPWTTMMEIYWGTETQAYVTPVAGGEVCVAVISRRKPKSFTEELAAFPNLLQRLRGAVPCGDVRGSVTLDRRLRRVTAGNVALVGDASGAVDALTGEGIALGVRQALALASALRYNDLPRYERQHRKLAQLPHFMSRTMLLMDRYPLVRMLSMRAFHNDPALFASMLRMHVGESMPSWTGRDGLLALASRLFTA